MDVPLLPDSRPRRFASISHQHPTVLSAVSRLHLVSQSQNYITTDGQSYSPSWCQVPIWGPMPDFYYSQTERVCLCGAPSLPRGQVCCLQLLLALASAVILGSESRRTHGHILLLQIRDSPNLGGQIPVFISPRNRAVQL
jgi:hypothetical protein